MSRNFWVNTLPFILVFFFLDSILGEAIDEFDNTPLVLSIWLQLFVANLLALIWGLVGLWKSSTKIFAANKKLSITLLGKLGFAELAQIGTTIFVLYFTYIYLFMAPAYVDLVKIAQNKDPYSTYTLGWADEDKTIVLFEGFIGYGLNNDLREILQRNPDVEYIQLESEGGRYTEAKKVAKTIREAGLKTYTQFECSSACTLAFIAGEERILDLEDGAVLGFHGASVSTLRGAARLSGGLDDFGDQLKKRGLPREFVDWAMAISPNDVWYPTPQILREAGAVTHFYINEDRGVIPAAEQKFQEKLFGFAEVKKIIQEADEALNEERDSAEIIELQSLALKTGWLSVINTANRHYIIATVLRVSREQEQAIEEYNKAISYVPNHWPFYYFRSLTYSDLYHAKKQQKFLEKALQDVDIYLQKVGENSDGLQTRAYYYIELKRFEESIADLTQARRLDPNNPSLLNNICWYKITEFRDYDTALSDCDRAIKLRDNFDAALHSRGLTHDILGNTELALADYRKAYDIAPERQNISKQAINFIESALKGLDVLDLAQGSWGLKQDSSGVQDWYNCDSKPLIVAIDAPAMKYMATNPVDNETFEAEILSVDGNRFEIRYVDEKRIDEDGNLVTWHFVMDDENTFYWIRDDWFIDVGNRLVFRGQRTEARKRCSSIS